MPLVRRALEPVLRRAAREFPAVLLTGPRQSGKTTLLRALFARTHGYVSLEPTDVRTAALADPRGFLDLHPAPVVLDEVQNAPGLLPYLQERIDERRDRPGQFLLSGSQDLRLQASVSQSLAGRVAVLHLLPLTRRERSGRRLAPLPWEAGYRAPRLAAAHGGEPVRRSPAVLWRALLRGGYPEIALAPRRDAGLWHGSYLQTYLERDVRALRQVGDLSQFQSFLRALAARSAQLLVLSDLARDLGVAVNTARAWLGVLEATHQVVLLRPFAANLTKRLVKTPKVYFTDTGTLAHLVGLRDPEHARAGPMAGALFETAVLGEIQRTLVHRGLPPAIHFWRTATGHEVDFLVEHEGRLVPLEAKLSATPSPAMGEAIRGLRRDLPAAVAPAGFVVHSGTVTLPLGPGVTAVPFAAL